MAKNAALGQLVVVAAVALLLQACEGSQLGPSPVQLKEDPAIAPAPGRTITSERSDASAPGNDEPAADAHEVQPSSTQERVGPSATSKFDLGSFLGNVLPQPSIPNLLVPPIITPPFLGPIGPIDPGGDAARGILNGQNPTDAIGNAARAPVGRPLRDSVVVAKANAGPGQPIPASMYAQLRAAGVNEYFLRQARWSTQWGAVDTYWTKDKDAVALQELIVFRNLHDVYENVLLWVHELKHSEQYERLGLDTFAAEYTLNSAKFEDEANRTEADAARAMNSRPTSGSFPGGSAPIPPNVAPVPPVNMPPVAPSAPTRTLLAYCQTTSGTFPFPLGGLTGTSCWVQPSWFFPPVYGRVVYL